SAPGGHSGGACHDNSSHRPSSAPAGIGQKASSARATDEARRRFPRRNIGVGCPIICWKSRVLVLGARPASPLPANMESATLGHHLLGRTPPAAMLALLA